MASSSSQSGSHPSLHRRLLQDISELQTQPYPNIELYSNERNIYEACLILTVEFYGALHLTVEFPERYPLSPPTIRMDSDIKHPNIYGSYICASILNTVEGYTSAYTLKSIAIQLLSFFSSDSIEQIEGGLAVDLRAYREKHRQNPTTYSCKTCIPRRIANPPSPQGLTAAVGPKTSKAIETSPVGLGQVNSATSNRNSLGVVPPVKGIVDAKLPDEVLLLLCDELETNDLTAFAEAWERVGSVMTTFDVIRTRELQCFCLKKDYRSTKLGVGVSVGGGRKARIIGSEFDLLSEEGFKTHKIRRSVQGVPFQYWLPLPISEGHWNRTRQDALVSLSDIWAGEHLSCAAPVQVIYNFMNDVVVKLNEKASATPSRAHYYRYGETHNKSTLTHASEKAIESYFHLFHLLLCLATEQPGILWSANEQLNKFIRGGTSKVDCPSLGHLLVAMLISDVEMTPEIMKSIIKEAVTRNVVWMLDKRGANMPELSYIEPNAVSNYRLCQTFQASKTSYRLLMFLNLFRKTAVGHPRKPLAQLRDEAFARHGAPPRGSAKLLADAIKNIHGVETFPDFFRTMGVEIPQEATFNAFLKSTIKDSVKAGYSSMPITQGQALSLRLEKEPGIDIGVPGITPAYVNTEMVSFFPAKEPPWRDSAKKNRHR